MSSLLLFTLAFVPAQSALPSQLPAVPFELNLGSQPAEVAFRASLAGGAAFVTTSGALVYDLSASRESRWSLVETFVGGSALPVGESETETRVSRFFGDDERAWTCDAPTYARVDLGRVWPGVQVDLAARGANFEKRFFVAPHAAPASIRVHVGGTCGLRVDESGALVANTGAGEVLFTAPIAWQERDGVREKVEVSYRVEGETYGFELGRYDATREVVIDPLLQATYLGGTAPDDLVAMAIDPATGSVYVAGQTASVDFPGTAGGAFPASAGGTEAFVAKLSSSLTTLQRATYYGGLGEDIGTGVAFGGGSVYLCGSTRAASVPGVAGGALPLRQGAIDGFIARFDAGLTVLQNATYFGGAEPYGDDFVHEVAFDASSGTLVAVGSTYATNLPGTVGSVEPGAHGNMDAYAVRLSANLTSIVIATYVGGTDQDHGNALVVQSGTGHVFVGGLTFSNNLLTQMGTGGAKNSYSNCGFCSDGYVVRLNPTFTVVEGGTYYGDFWVNWIVDLAQGPDGTLYGVGTTSTVAGSTGVLPGTVNGAQAHPGSGDEAYVVRLANDLQVIYNASYLGGAMEDWGYGVDVDPATGDVLVSGHSSSWDLPASQFGAQSFLADYAPGIASQDGFVSRLTFGLTAFVCTSYYGGQYGELAKVVRVAPSGQIYIAGVSGSANLPGTVGGAQPAQSAFTDGYVARFDAGLTGAGGGTPHVYCASGTTFNACQPSISATANPSVSHATACTISATSLEGQQNGLIFYSTFGRWGALWCGTSGYSYLCAKMPLERTSVQNSGGTAGACDGTIALPWNAWHIANPGAAGNFIVAGQILDAQCWFRDPGSCRNTSMSNAVELTMLP